MPPEITTAASAISSYGFEGAVVLILLVALGYFGKKLLLIFESKMTQLIRQIERLGEQNANNLKELGAVHRDAVESNNQSHERIVVQILDRIPKDGGKKS